MIIDADKHSFSLVCQYLYTGDYSITFRSGTPPPDLVSGGQEKPERNHIVFLEGNLFRDTEMVEKIRGLLCEADSATAF